MKYLLLVAALVVGVPLALFIWMKRTQDAALKKALRAVLITLGALAALLAVLLGMFLYEVDYKRYPVAAWTSPDGAWELAAVQLGEPGFPFGPASCALELRRGGRLAARRDVTVSNDGGDARPEDFAVTWAPDAVTVIVSGEEQEDETWVISFEGAK